MEEARLLEENAKREDEEERERLKEIERQEEERKMREERQRAREGLYLVFITSPILKVHVSYCHHLVSVSPVTFSSFNLLLRNY